MNSIYNLLMLRWARRQEHSDSSSSGDWSDSSSSSSSSGGGIPTDYDWYTPFTTDYTEAVSGIAGVPTREGICEIVEDSRFGGYLDMHKTSGGYLTGLEFPGTQSSLAYGTGAFAMSFWLNAPYWNSYGQAIISHRGNGTGYDRKTGFVIFKDSSNTMDMRIGNNSSQCKSFNVQTDGTWHHCLYQRNFDGTWGWYEDGVLKTSGTGFSSGHDATCNSGVNVIIGGDGDWGKKAYFKLTHMRIYGRALTSDEITALANEDFNIPAGPTDYVFRAPLANDLNDVSASSRTGTAAGGTATTGEVKDGVACTYIPQAVKVTWPIGDVALGSSPRTVSLWFYTESINSSWNTMLSYGSNSAHYYLFAMGYHQSGNYAFTAWWNDLDSGLGTATASEWHNFTVSYDGTDIKAYVDGVFKKSKTTSDIDTATSDITVGARSYNSDYAGDMWFADVRIYNRALTDAEIAAIASKIN